MDLSSFLQNTRKKFQNAQLDTPDIDARFLIQDLLGLTATEMVAGDRVLTSQEQELLNSAIERRLNGEPVSRILGYREFWGRKFFLSSATLDPRPDTETLIEAVLATAPKLPLHILDLGTGTGCILLTLVAELANSTGIGVDLSADACATAQRNAQALGLENRVQILTGNWLEPVTGRFDIIVSNPPYIPSSAILNLHREVRNHDPILALDGGIDGLAPYKYLLSNLKKFLEPDGSVFFEIGHDQLADIERLVSDSNATLSRTLVDLGGKPRVVEITYGDK